MLGTTDSGANRSRHSAGDPVVGSMPYFSWKEDQPWLEF